MESTIYTPDLWDLEGENVFLSILLPNGIYLCLEIRKNASLFEVKEEMWKLAQQSPLFGNLKDKDSYVLQCINSTTAQREVLDEERLLNEVRPFQCVLLVVENIMENNLLSARLRSIIGRDIQELTESNAEVQDFSKQMKGFCESVTTPMEPCASDSFETQILRQYPVTLEKSQRIPHYLQSKLEATNGNILFLIHFDQDCQYSQKFKISVPLDINATELCDRILKDRGLSLGLQKKKNYILKICGFEEYLIGSHKLLQYKYVKDSLSADKVPELVLMSSDSIQLETCCRERNLNRDFERRRSRKASNKGSTSSRRKKITAVSTWSIEEPLLLKIHHINKFKYANQIRVGVQCGIFHGTEMLCEYLHTSNKLVEDGKANWEEYLKFDIALCNIPRMAKLCLCIYEFSSVKNNVRFRKFEEGYACPIAWVNTTVFDYRGVLRCACTTLYTWPYNPETDEFTSMMLYPLGFAMSNQADNQSSVLVISFGKYSQTARVAYPSLTEVLDYAKEDLSDNNSACSSDDFKSDLEKLRQISDKDSLYSLHKQEAELMWSLRYECCFCLPHSLSKLLKCVKWNDKHSISQMTALLQIWPRISPYKALELLDYAYPDPLVRRFAVECLRALGDEELPLFMLQLVQALKHEPYLQNDLTKFLLERALIHRHIGHRLFWLLRSQINFPSVYARFSLILEAYCRNIPLALHVLEKQVQAVNKLKTANRYVKNVSIKKEGRLKTKMFVQDLLAKNSYQAIFRGLQSPLDPRLKFGKLKVAKCKALDSKMKPLWLVFENMDVHGQDVFVIFKYGDDLRQDMLTLQMIRIMDRLWKNEGLDLRVIPYQCMATGIRVGLIEVVPKADTIANIQKKKGSSLTSAFKKGSILSWLKDCNPDDNSLNKAVEEFTLSCAGYCVATYVLGIADRHSDNIMVKTNGQLFHVDFGHILGKYKEKFGFKRERVPFVLTHDFVHIITKGHSKRSDEFSRFQQYCESAFMILRKKGSLFISLFAMMLCTGIPELSSEKDLDYLRDTLVMDMPDQEALLHFRSKFNDALKNSWKMSINWMAHNWARDNKMSD